MSDRPPLAAELFDDRREFSAAMQRYPQCQPIIPYLRDHSTGTVEEVLEGFQSEAADYPERHRQLAAIRYYLQMMLWAGEERLKKTTRDITNYKTLLDQIARWRKPTEQVCLVTFNYDRMVEAALPVVSVRIRHLRDYVGNDNYKLFKLHGSVDWGRVIDAPTLNPALNGWELAEAIIDNAVNLIVSNTFRISTSHPLPRAGQEILFPAIAIPVQSKTHFECPEEHINVLQELIPQTTKLLMSGWRASEDHFLKLLAEGIKGRRIPVMSVAGGHQEAEQSVSNLKNAHIGVDAVRFDGGFTDFIVTRAGDDFLNM
jgi:hypothetical protein